MKLRSRCSSLTVVLAENELPATSWPLCACLPETTTWTWCRAAGVRCVADVGAGVRKLLMEIYCARKELAVGLVEADNSSSSCR